VPKHGVGIQLDEEIPAPGIASSAAAEVVIDAATGADFAVAATGPAQYRLSRTYRPGWVVPAAIVGALFFGLGLLLLILVPKRNETCLVAVNEGHRGVSVRLSGVLPRTSVDQIRLGLGVGSAPVTPALTNPISPRPSTIDARRSPLGPSPSPGSARTGSTFASWGPVDSPTASAAPAETTVARIGPPSTRHPADPAIRIGAELIPLSDGVVVGRNPAPADVLPSARLVAIADAGLSKTHLAIRAVDCTVEICDLSSTNGTVVETVSARRACVPGVWLAVDEGSRIVAGDQRMEITS